MKIAIRHVPAWPRLLGLAGLLPQISAAAALLSGDPALAFPAVSLGFCYAILIFSFLGGSWWGMAAAAGRTDWPIYAAAVAPAIIALATCLPWAFGGDWPQPSLVLLGLGILATLLADRWLVRAGIAPDWWLGLRLPLSLGLGGLTLLLGLYPLPVIG